MTKDGIVLVKVLVNLPGVGIWNVSSVYNLVRPSLEVTIIISKYQMPLPSDSFYQSQYTSKKITVNFNCQSLTPAHYISPFSGFRMTLDTEKDEISGIK